jgi:hypothetical protein
MMKPAIVLLTVLLTAQFSPGRSQGQSARESLKVAAAVAPEWPRGNVAVGREEVQIVVTTDGYFGNVIEAEPKGPSSIFSQPSEIAARLWKFSPSKPNSKQTLTFVFEAFAKGDHTRRPRTTFIPPYRVVIERPEE